MKKPLIALILLGLGLPIGCTVEEDPPPDPLAKAAGFCQAWGEAACSGDVVEFCNAKSAESCQDTQSDFCLGILPENYSSAHAKECLAAVQDAYVDATLTADEIAVVLHLAAPCDQLSKGTRTSGQSCTANDDCDTAGGFSCIKKQGSADGSCAKPEMVAAGDDCGGPSQVCDDTHYCNGDNCVTFKKTGGACDGDYQCKSTDRCVKEADADSGTCEVRAAANEACTQDADCQTGYCVIDSDASEGVCVKTIRLSRTEPLCENLR
ncbi:MAG TPA: hypothetical protein VEQ59_14745 [Polyangiaceae bacterium]|nr:hypothetical protein [Polyangiaceae bacterium]